VLKFPSAKRSGISPGQLAGCALHAPPPIIAISYSICSKLFLKSTWIIVYAMKASPRKREKLAKDPKPRADRQTVCLVDDLMAIIFNMMPALTRVWCVQLHVQQSFVLPADLNPLPDRPRIF
jgi:hypothetical protein